MSSPEQQATISQDQFIRLYSESHRRLFTYIMAQVGSAADAEDILQETSVVLWHKKNEFTPGTNFTAWAYGVARNKVLQFHASKKRLALQMSDELAGMLADDLNHLQNELDVRHRVLADCLAQLPEADRDLIHRRYDGGSSIKSIAETLGRPLEGLYKVMKRIHRNLKTCADKKMKVEQA